MSVLSPFEPVTADTPRRLDHGEVRILNKWLSELATVKAVCRVNGHWWDQDFLPGTRYGVNTDGSYEISQTCRRQIDGEGCGVRRRRFIGKQRGYIDKPNAMDYSGAAGYLLPEELASWSGARDVNGLIRLEIRKRAAAGEKVSDDVAS